MERDGRNRKQRASEGRTKSQPWQVTEHRASVQCPVSAEGRRNKRGRGKARVPGCLWKHSGVGANTKIREVGAKLGQTRDTGRDTKPSFQRTGSKTALSCGWRSREEVRLPESVYLTSEVPAQASEPQA